MFEALFDPSVLVSVELSCDVSRVKHRRASSASGADAHCAQLQTFTTASQQQQLEKDREMMGSWREILKKHKHVHSQNKRQEIEQRIHVFDKVKKKRFLTIVFLFFLRDRFTETVHSALL